MGKDLGPGRPLPPRTSCFPEPGGRRPRFVCFESARSVRPGPGGIKGQGGDQGGGWAGGGGERLEMQGWRSAAGREERQGADSGDAGSKVGTRQPKVAAPAAGRKMLPGREAGDGGPRGLSAGTQAEVLGFGPGLSSTLQASRYPHPSVSQVGTAPGPPGPAQPPARQVGLGRGRGPRAPASWW